jgi:hypothetical protein
MLFDPDAGKSIEEIILEAWEYKITPHRRADILPIAEESGRKWFEVVCGYTQDYCEAAKDPITGPRLKAPGSFSKHRLAKTLPYRRASKMIVPLTLKRGLSLLGPAG